MIPSSLGLFFWCAAALGSGILLFLYPAAAAAGVLRGLSLCVQSVIPALFPYMVITSLLLSQPTAVALLSLPVRPLGRLMGQKNKTFCTVLLLCALGGFASAANCIASALKQGQLTPRQAKMLCFCGLYASPAFVCNVVGPGLGGGAGPLLLAAGIAAGLACCLLAPLFCREKGTGGLNGAARPGPSLAAAPLTPSHAVERPP